MKKVFITVPILLGLFYIFSAMHSLHQFHRGIYANDKKLIKEYVDWDALKNNLKNYLKVTLLKNDLGILFAGITGSIVQYTVETYVNPEGLSLLLENFLRENQIPEPTVETLFLGFKLMKFNGLDSFYIDYEHEEEVLEIHFDREHLKWKLTQIDFPKSLFADLQ